MTTGEVLITRDYDHHTGRDRLRIKRADPRARISAHLILEIQRADSPWATLNGDTLTLTDSDGRRFIYRIDWTDYQPADQSFLMEWPD